MTRIRSEMHPDEGWVGVEEVAVHLQVAKDSIYRWTESKGFPAHRVGRLLRFKLSEVDEWVMAARHQAQEGLRERKSAHGGRRKGGKKT